ncbi:PREDICTED: uncharacterized protein LOC108621206 [Drosophila arizonae]|uniref:Uncharacterized protein LOC108621206 n=1 Tax=Drosophila arizonae TaxID=7263 RepID=A0ABM1Q340_DROAR|nr:PREDICTED: uncharacterized protein LOC108621206 [Drosophila arizonae]
MKLIYAACVLLGLALSHASASCSADCPDTEDVVWAVGGGCSVFRNKCYFDRENCHRKPPLTISTKEECQKLCPSVCPLIYQPIGGTYKGQSRHFGNACEKIVHTCRTGETFLD